MNRRLTLASLMFALGVTLVAFAQNQASTALSPNEPITFVLAPAGERTFEIYLKKDDVAEISWLANEELELSFALYDPSGKNIIDEDSAMTDSLPFVAPAEGKYLLTIKMADNSSGADAGQKITLKYSNRLSLPTRTTKNDIRRINGYEVRILESAGDNAQSYLLIEKNGRFKKIYKSDGSLAAGFYFGDDLSHTYSASDRASALLIKNTLDKTGDGNPDVQVGYYTGGAHCCFITLFFELGDSVTAVPTITTNNAELRAIGKTPQGSLRFETFDDTFAYWLTSFAESPMPRVVLEFRKGVLSSNFELMKKPAPSFATLRNNARPKRAAIDLEPYKNVNDSSFDVVFWDTMLDLIYTGHEELAWQYLDLVWPTRKPGKEIFIQDFKHQLAQSPLWQLIQSAPRRK